MKVSLFQGILIAVFGLSAVFGLFVFSTYKGGGSAAEEIGKVVVWGTIPRGGVNSALVEIGKSENGLKSLSYVEKNATTLPSELANAIATNQAPDLVLASHEELYSMRRYITPIPTEAVSPSNFSSAFIDESSLLIIPDGGGYYGLPVLVDPLVLFWNNDILASAGIAQPPTTWEGLVGLVPNLAQLTPTKQVTRGLIALGTYENVENARSILSALFLQTKVPISSPGGGGLYRVNFNSASSGRTSGEAVLGFYTQFADPRKVSYTWNSSLPNSRQAFQTGDLALYLGHASEAKTLRALNPNLNFRVSPIPQPATASGKITYGKLYSLSLVNGSRNGSGAFKATALLTNVAQQQPLAAATGLAPAARAAIGSPPADAVAIVAYASALYSKGWMSPPAGSVDTVFASMINDVITGRLQPTPALTKAEGALSLLLQR